MPCPTCGQPVTSDVPRTVDRIDGLRSRIEALEKKLEHARVDVNGYVRIFDGPIGARRVDPSEALAGRLDEMHERVKRLEVERINLRSTLYNFLEQTKR